MNRRTVLVTTGALTALLSLGHVTAAQTVQPCPNADNCVQVGVVNVGTGSGTSGDTVTVGVTFKNAPATGDQGGPDKIAAVALTILESGGGAVPVPLTLASCTFSCLGGDNAGNACTTDGDCPNGQCLVAAVKPTALLSGFKAVVENASCANGRTHCLCPDAGQTLDNFINLVVYGPNPLPATGPVTIPTLPDGQLLTIDLTIAANVQGDVKLHPINQPTDSGQHPQFTALLSVGDKTAVDQTCSPLATTGVAPCTAPSSVSQVATSDATITVEASGPCPAGDQIGAACPQPPNCVCVDDCDGSTDVFGNEVTKAVNIVAGNLDLTSCMAADANCDGDVFGNEVTIGVNNVANGCPGSQ